MANIKSAKKRVLVSQKKAERNKAVKSETKTYVKAVNAAIEAGNKEEAEKALRAAEIKLRKASTKGVYHKNKSSRKVSRLTKAVKGME